MDLRTITVVLYSLSPPSITYTLPVIDCSSWIVALITIYLDMYTSIPLSCLLHLYCSQKHKINSQICHFQNGNCLHLFKIFMILLHKYIIGTMCFSISQLILLVDFVFVLLTSSVTSEVCLKYTFAQKSRCQNIPCRKYT